MSLYLRGYLNQNRGQKGQKTHLKHGGAVGRLLTAGRAPVFIFSIRMEKSYVLGADFDDFIACERR